MGAVPESVRAMTCARLPRGSTAAPCPSPWNSARETDADDGVLRRDADELLKDLARRRRRDESDVFKHIVQVIAQGARESRRGADAEHIDAARLQQGLHRAGEGLAVQMLVRMAQPVHIRLQDRRDDVPPPNVHNVTSMRCTEVRRLSTISCSARCMAG